MRHERNTTMFDPESTESQLHSYDTEAGEHTRPASEGNHVIEQSDRPASEGNHVIEQSDRSASEGNHVIEQSDRLASEGNHVIEQSDHPASEGNHVIEELARMYPQLYLAPGEEGKRLYPEVVLKGYPAPSTDLSHFRGSGIDDCRMAQTPAGEVRVVTLGLRADFVTFLQIMANRCAPVDIPRTQGAAFLNGVICRGKIAAHKKEYFQKAADRDGNEPDIFQWLEEEKRFTAVKSNYTDALLILSVGPYSFIPAADFGYPEEKWLEYSHTIRLYHECTHFVCYKLHPGKRDAVRDELIADAVGIIAALGHFDQKMAEHFLGISGGKYTGGRLENYTDHPGQLIPSIEKTLSEIKEAACANAQMPPLDLALYLDEAV